MSQAPSIAAREKRLLKALHAQPALLACMEELVELTRVESAEAVCTADEIEEKVVAQVRHLGREVISGWAKRAEAQVTAEVRRAHPKARLREKKRVCWHTTFGPVALQERVWRLPGQAGHYHRPFAARVGVSARGCSRRLARAAADFGCERSFARASEQLFEHYGVCLCASSLREVTLRQARAIAARAAGAGPVRTLPKRGAAKVVVAEADGTMLPIVTPQATAASRDKRKGRPVCWQEARLAAARAQGRTRTHFGATLEGGVEEAGVRWAQAAKAAGWGLDGHVHAVGDGAPWLCEQAKSHFGKQGSYLLDFFHVSEYLAAAAAGLHPGDTPAAQAWLAAQQQALKASQSAAVLARLAAASEPAEVPEEHAPVRCAQRYLANRP